VSILNPLADLVAWAIIHIHVALGALFGPNTGLAWGLSIAVLVIIIRLLLVPLFVKQVQAQRKMAQHAPQLQELRKKYKNDKQRLNEETMAFYKANGVNPLAGCLPMIPQMIVFFSLFYVLRAIADWKPGLTPKYGLTVPILQSAQKATIFGVHLGDKLLFAHPSPPLHVAIVIALTVVVSASTTFMTVRQTSKRGLMQTGVDPDNPMAQSQKYMMYIIPFFSLTGLYWQYGLVLYWVTTNLWTLGQQYFMFRNWEPPVPATAGTAGTTVRTTGSSLRPTSSATRPAAGGSAKAPSGGGRTAASNGRSDKSGPQGSAAGGPRSRSAPRGESATAYDPRTGQNGTEKRGLLRLGRAKPEPEPEPDVPSAKVVRQQPVRQAKSKRSGKR
jgi:YidC/Oxa1 family membrane protein insertase